MSENEQQSENTITNQQIEEVVYADPESPTLAIRRLASPTTGPHERPTDIVETNNNADTSDTVLPAGAPTQATTAEEAPTTSITSATKQRRSWDGTLLNDDEIMVYSLSHP